jgi:hypothetical protein
MCTAPPQGITQQYSLGVGGTGLESSSIGPTSFTYDGPILTSALLPNTPPSAGTFVTIAGRNFG